MTTRIHRGDAPATARVVHVTPANVEIGDVFTLTINGKSVSCTATVASVANVTAGLVSAWNDSTIAEFAEITASDATTHVVLTADTAGIPFEVSGTAVDGGGTDTQTITIAEQTRSAGPNHADAARNWTGNRVPDSGDDVVLDRSLAGLLYGLLWRTTSTFDAGTDVWTMDEAADFVDDQILRLRNSGGGLPAGYAVDTDYYVINLDRDARTLQLSATSGGSAVNGTTAGTGTHTIGVELGSLTIRPGFSKQENVVGLPRLNGADYYEYRPRYWTLGAKTATPDVPIVVGDRDRSGSTRLNLDLQGYPIDFELRSSGRGTETDVPAVLLLANDSSSANVTVLDGELGLSVLPGETASIAKLTQRDGEVAMRNVTIGNGIEKTGGVLEGENVTVSGGTLTL